VENDMSARRRAASDRGKRPTPAGPRGGQAGERLQKILARAGLGSRRSCEGLIAEGRVAVNGAVVLEPGTRADPARDGITVDGRRIRADNLVYYALNKPRGVISTTDAAAEDAVLDLVPPQPRVFPVGRLDVDSEGLMVFTNDGELANRMTHPRYGLERVYRVEVKGAVTREALDKLRKGVHLAEGKTLPPGVQVLREAPEGGTLEVTVREGLNREVRRMLAAVGLKVKRLARIRLGPLALGRLRPGEFRELDPSELAELRAEVSGPGEAPPPWLKRRKRPPHRAPR